jgi:hypothetical protein
MPGSITSCPDCKSRDMQKAAHGWTRSACGCQVQTTVQSGIVGTYAVYVVCKTTPGGWTLLVHVMSTGMVSVPFGEIRQAEAEEEGLLRMERAFAAAWPRGLLRLTGLRLADKAIQEASCLPVDELFTKCGRDNHRNMKVTVEKPVALPGPHGGSRRGRWIPRMVSHHSPQ